MKSYSEIETTSKRASRAVGFSWGIAEEIAKGIRSLELFGLPGIQNLNEYFKKKTKKNFENLKIIKKNNNLNKLPLCPINIGVNFLDQIWSLEKFKKITFQKLAYPVLILPFLNRTSEIVGKKILVKFDKNEILLNFNISVSLNTLSKKFPSISKKTEIFFIENKDSFSISEWKNLYKLSENTFVEETESLKKGAAGAGLTDND